MQRHGRMQNHGVLLTAVLVLVLGGLSGGSSARTSRAAATGLGIANVRVSRDGYTAHGQPSLAVNPRDPRNLLGAAMAMGAATLVEETFVSFDDGRTWHDNGPLPLPAGVSFGGDPTVAFDARGVGFVASLGEPQSGDGVYVWRSDDGGRSFHLPVAIAQGQPADHPWLAIDPAPGSGSGDLYVAWATRDVADLGHAGGLAFSRSTDEGRTFAPPRIISAPASGVSIPAAAAGPRGAVSIAYVTLRRARAQGSRTNGGLPAAGVNAEEVQVVSSADHGRTFGRPSVVGPATTLLMATPQVFLTTQPSLAIDRHDGSVYVAYSAYRTGTTHAGILLARSRDGGHTWDAPVRVTTVPGPTAFFQPHVVVDAQGGIDVTYFALVHGQVTMLLTRSTMRGASFEVPQQVTSRAFDPTLGWHGQKTGAWWIGDYQGLAAGGGMIHPFWNDTRTGQLEIFTAAISVAAAH